MKPRFSLLTLLAMTAYVGLTVAAFVQPLSVLPYIHFAVAAVALLTAAVIACGPSSSGSAFCKGMVLFTILYFVLMSWEPSSTSSPLGLLDWPWWHFYSSVTSVSPTEEEMTVASRLGTITRVNVELAFGLLGGCLSVWRYRSVASRAMSADAHSDEHLSG